MTLLALTILKFFAFVGLVMQAAVAIIGGAALIGVVLVVASMLNHPRR
jgi:hypothetical protein